MKEWKQWNLKMWNERLLFQFFRSNEERPLPIVVLLVTTDELARAAGDPNANPEEVRDAFICSVRAGLARSRSLLEDASDYLGWPGPPDPELSPRFVAHLIFTCVAASESSDELADEGSFISRLRDLTNDQLPEHSLPMLARLWEHLVVWLAANEGKYRQLTLPDPGRFTRIGYTVKLAFPDRRDQKLLSELLDSAGLSGQEPPVGRVVSLVASERGGFRESFLRAFNEFRRLFETSVGRAVPGLLNHRFWAAVREAALRGRGQPRFSDATVRISFLAAEEEDRLALFAVADQRNDEADVEFLELPFPSGPWRFALSPKGAQTLDAQQLQEVAQAILDGSLRLPRLASYVAQGLLPFFVGTHGLLELADREQLGDVSVALVREGMHLDLFHVLGRGSATTRPSAYAKWVQVHDLDLRALPFAKLDGTLLSRTWILHESVRPTSIRLVGGVPADDGWLAVHEVLPQVTVPDASTVVLKYADKELTLTRLNDGSWAFPSEDLIGEFLIVASLDGGEDRRKIRFNAAPASEVFKGPSDPDAWIVEEVSGTGTLSSFGGMATDMRDNDCARLCERIAYLSPDVGVFTGTDDQSAWCITHFAGRLTGLRGALRGESAMPSAQVENATARRRWRKMLFDSVPSWSDPGFEKARGHLRASLSTHEQLPKIELKQPVPNLMPIRLSSPRTTVDRLVRIVSGLAATRSGIDWRDWAVLAQRILDIDVPLLAQVTRAWMEAGLIDIGSSARWWHRSVFARTPHLLAFKIAEQAGATLSGLALSTTVAEVQRIALQIGMLVEERFSVSSLVPNTISLRAPNAQSLQDLGAACGLKLFWIDLSCLEHGLSSRHNGTSVPPEHYEEVRRWPYWSLKKGDHSEVTVEHRMRRDRPDYWIVSREEFRLWFYDLNVTRCWGAALLREPLVMEAGEWFLEANHAYVPLPIARVVNLLGLGLAGPTDHGRYRYALGMELRKQVLDIILRTFDPRQVAITKR
jgi:hypothetical protein